MEGYTVWVLTRLCRRLLLLAAGPVLLAAGPAPELVAAARRPPRKLVRGAVDASAATIEVTGRLFYEDHRKLGVHHQRTDPAGERGRKRTLRTELVQDYLGAHFMTVELYEVDRARGEGCSPAVWVGAATVAPDGSFTARVPAADPCASESEPRFVISASTGHCDDELCFYVGRRVTTPFVLWFGRMRPFAAGELPDLVFRPKGLPRITVEAQAANHHASLVDAIVAMHVEGGIPFRREEYGPLTVRFPSPYSDGRATRADLIDANNKRWPKGGLVIHEYGHIVHRRAWGGDYAGFPKPVQAWNGKKHSKEVPFIAFKEGWANFVASYTLGRCGRPSFDEADVLVSLERPVDGRHFPQNHHRALCDWVDDHVDQRPGTQRADTLSMELYRLWQTLDATDELWSERGIVPGLDMCDLAATHVVTGDASERAGRLEAVLGVLETNDISCPELAVELAP